MVSSSHHHKTDIISHDAPTYQEMLESYDPNKNTSVPFLTIYERTTLLSLRMQQLAGNAQTLLDDAFVSHLRTKHMGNRLLLAIAEEELKRKIIPFDLCRTFPNGSVEFVKLDDLLIMD
jgi:hypothetical protein